MIDIRYQLRREEMRAQKEPAQTFGLEGFKPSISRMPSKRRTVKPQLPQTYGFEPIDFLVVLHFHDLYISND